MTADIDRDAREAMAGCEAIQGGISARQFQQFNALARHAIRFTLSRYAPHELPDPVKELADKLVTEWEDVDDDCSYRTLAAFIIRRTREEDAKVAK
jgi:hypothetical protein